MSERGWQRKVDDPIPLQGEWMGFFGLERETAREFAELGAVFVILGGLLGFLHEQGFGSDTVIGAVAGGLLFALILGVGALLGMIGHKS